jgi:hypothetical protein
MNEAFVLINAPSVSTNTLFALINVACALANALFVLTFAAFVSIIGANHRPSAAKLTISGANSGLQ